MSNEPSASGNDRSDGVEKLVPDSHPDSETIAYCPGCEAELSDFYLGVNGSGNTPPGRCRRCGSRVWMSFLALDLIQSEYVTVGMLREARGKQDIEDGKEVDPA